MSDDSDYEHEDSECDDDDVDTSSSTGSLVKTLFWYGAGDEEQLSNEQQEELARQFALKFFNQSTSSEILFSPDSLKQTIQNSLCHSQSPRRLILYIHHDEAIAANLFLRQLTQTEALVSCLNEGFVLWPWDRTQTNNYHHLLKLIQHHFGHEVALQLACYSDSIDSYPLMVCLATRSDRIEIANIIDSTTPIANIVPILLDTEEAARRHIILQKSSSRKLWYIVRDLKTQYSLENLCRQLHTFVGHLVDIKDTKENIVQFEGALSRTHPKDAVLFFCCPLFLARALIKDGFPNRFECSDEFYDAKWSSHLKQVAKKKETLAEQPVILVCCVYSADVRSRTDSLTYVSEVNGRNVLRDMSDFHPVPQYLITYKT